MRDADHPIDRAGRLAQLRKARQDTVVGLDGRVAQHRLHLGLGAARTTVGLRRLHRNQRYGFAGYVDAAGQLWDCRFQRTSRLAVTHSWLRIDDRRPLVGR
jgi:hypothetical protein